MEILYLSHDGRIRGERKLIVLDLDRVGHKTREDDCISGIRPSSLDTDNLTGCDCSTAHDSKTGERHQRKSWIARRAADDETGRKGVDFIEIQWSIKGRWDWIAFVGTKEVRVVSSLDGEDRSSGREISLGGNGCCSSEISTYTNTTMSRCL
jgi:hypothetical protein